MTPALPGAAADPGLRGRFPEAPDGGGARVQDRDGFEAALQAASVAGSFVLTRGPALFSRVKQMEDTLETAAPATASNVEPRAFLAPMEPLSSLGAPRTLGSSGAPGGPATGTDAEVVEVAGAATV